MIIEKSKITIDHREKDLILLLNDLNCIEFSVETLQNADISIQGNISILIERKRIDDFYASLRDNRFHEQKDRIKETGADHIIYMIEGNDKNAGRGSFGIDILEKTLWTMLLSEKIRIVRTEDINESARFICHMFSKTNTVNTNTNTGGYVIPISKKQMINGDNVYIAMLRMIPGISLPIASSIASTYKTFPSLITALENDYKAVEDLDVQFPKCVRKLGKKAVVQLKKQLLDTLENDLILT